MIPWYAVLSIAISICIGSLITSYIMGTLDPIHYALTLGLFIGALSSGFIILWFANDALKQHTTKGE